MTEMYFKREFILIVQDGVHYRFEIGTPQYNALADMHDFVLAFMC